MFATNTVEVLNFETPNKTENLFTKILFAYKKLKEIAKYESDLSSEFQIARLHPEQLEKLKSLESNLGYCLIAYEQQLHLKNKKSEILNKISLLLNEYSKLCKSSKNQRKTTLDDFAKFFE